MTVGMGRPSSAGKVIKKDVLLKSLSSVCKERAGGRKGKWGRDEEKNKEGGIIINAKATCSVTLQGLQNVCTGNSH